MNQQLSEVSKQRLFNFRRSRLSHDDRRRSDRSNRFGGCLWTRRPRVTFSVPSFPVEERSGVALAASPPVGPALLPCAAHAESPLDAECSAAVLVAAPDAAPALFLSAVHARSLLDAGRSRAAPVALLHARLVWPPCAEKCSLA
jgi:hypothetical protein